MKVGIFDSGLGGLTVLKAIRNRYDSVDIVYLGDTARVPYGTKSADTVIRYSVECSNFLTEKGVDLLVVACNTASSYALGKLKSELEIPVVGVVEPGVRKAIKISKNGKIGVIGTTATINSGTYQKMIKKAGRESIAKACPLFVPLVEEGLTEGEIAEAVVRYYLEDIKDSGIDTLILGCTHYPLLRKTISEYLNGINIVDSADAVAESISGFIENIGNSNTELYFTDVSQNLESMVKRILGNDSFISVVGTLCSL